MGQVYIIETIVFQDRFLFFFFNPGKIFKINVEIYTFSTLTYTQALLKCVIINLISILQY